MPQTLTQTTTVRPTSVEAREAVNIFASIDVLGLLADPDYPGSGTIEDQIKQHYINVSSADASLKQLARDQPLQSWNENKQRYEFNAIWNLIIQGAANSPKHFASTSGTKEILNKYVRLIANRGDTQGWKLEVDGSDLTPTSPQYLTQAYNLSVKAKPSQWLRWWGNSITPFSALQCVIGKITNENRPQDLAQLQNQQNASVVYNYPSAEAGTSSYNTASNTAFSRLGQLKPDVQVGTKIQYDILFNLVDSEGDVIARFQVDPEIIVTR